MREMLAAPREKVGTKCAREFAVELLDVIHGWMCQDDVLVAPRQAGLKHRAQQHGLPGGKKIGSGRCILYT